MNLSTLPLKQLLELLKAKEWLQTKLDEVNHDLQRLENGNVSAPSAMEVQALEKNANESEKILSQWCPTVEEKFCCKLLD